jgi:hypothetical protein
MPVVVFERICWMEPQDMVVLEGELSEFAAWKWGLFRAWEIDALALGDESPGAFGV